VQERAAETLQFTIKNDYHKTVPPPGTQQLEEFYNRLPLATGAPAMDPKLRFGPRNKTRKLVTGRLAVAAEPTNNVASADANTTDNSSTNDAGSNSGGSKKRKQQASRH
jgi:hypothetical protein